MIFASPCLCRMMREEDAAQQYPRAILKKTGLKDGAWSVVGNNAGLRDALSPQNIIIDFSIDDIIMIHTYQPASKIQQ